MTPRAIPLVHVRCPLCGAERSRPVLRGRDRWHGLPGAFQVVECGGCRMRYQDPQPAPAALGLIYPADYQAYTPRPARQGLARRLRQRMRQVALRRPTTIGERLWSFVLWRLVRLRRDSDRLIRMRGAGRLLDVGSGAGAYLAEMRAFGWRVVGVEPDPGAARRAREQLGLDVRTGDLSSADLPASSFDVVTFWHVLEHVPDPRETLRRARDLLRPGGEVVVQVPNAAGACARLFGPHWLGLDLPRHLWQFTDRTLRRMLVSAGFKVRRIRHERLADGWKWSLRRRWPGSRFLQRRKRLWRLAADVAAMLGMADCVTAVAERPAGRASGGAP